MMPKYVARAGTISICLLIVTVVCAQQPIAAPNDSSAPQDSTASNTDMNESTSNVATFGSGCFWCTEAVFQQIKGVTEVVSGYAGGEVEDPTYEEVCSGRTGHAEVIQITYDPNVVSYEALLEVFWKSHDPTTRNRQGADVGTQYRSIVMVHDERQQELAEHYRQKLDESGAFPAPIVTEIVPASKFYPAEKYHQNYFNLNQNQPYCRAIIAPKIDKVREVFADKLVE